MCFAMSRSTNQRMKYCLFTTGFPPIVGGQPNYVYSRCVANPDNLLVVAREVDGQETFDRAQPFPVKRFSYPETRSGDSLTRVRQVLSATLALRRAAGASGPEILEVSTLFPGVLAAVLAFPHRRFPIVSYALGDDVLKPLKLSGLKQWILKVALSRVKLFVAISNYTRSRLVEAGIEPSRIILVHPTINYSLYGRAGNPERVRQLLPTHGLMLLTVCKLFPKKNVEGVIRLLPRLLARFPELLYVVAGDGIDMPRLRKLTSDLHLEDHVVFMGQVADELMPDLYAAADVFALLTREDAVSGTVEGFGIVFLEAGSQGVPVIGPIEGGAGDAVEEGRSGYLVDPENEDEVVEKLELLLSDPSLRARLGAAGKVRALRPPDWRPLFDWYSR